MKRTLPILLLLVLSLATTLPQSKGGGLAKSTIPAFEPWKNDIAITRIAQQTQYFDKIGLQAGLMGSENGSFEMWIWPWKPLRDFGLIP